MPSEFFVALVSSSETVFSESEHARKDYVVAAFEIVHNEGDYPRLTIDIKNPRSGGFLDPLKKQWLWLSSLELNGEIEPLFFGRIVGTPEDLHDEHLRLTYIARPADIESLRSTLAASLQVSPYWDPVFIAEEQRDDLDAVIDARPVRWHVDRTTLELTVSDITSGEDGTETIPNSDIAYESVGMSYSVPLRKVSVEAKVYWDQISTGILDIQKTLLTAAKAAGSNGNTIQTYTGSGFANDLPKDGTRVGAGWTVEKAALRRGEGIWEPVRFKTIIMTDASVNNFPLFSFRPTFLVRWDAARSKSEVLTFDLEADVQPIIAEAGDDEKLKMNFASADVGEPIDDPDSDNPDGTLPIQDRSRRSFFLTGRGREALEFLISSARTKLLQRARAVQIQFETTWDYGLLLSCRKNITINDPRMPGGTATGKIIGYAILAGDDGAAVRVTIGCMVGNGNTVSVSAGTESYVETDYVEDGYQVMIGQTIMPISGEVTYNDFSDTEIDDDGINFADMTELTSVILNSEEPNSTLMFSGKRDQEAALEAFAASPTNAGTDIAGAMDALNQIPSVMRVTLRPLTGGPFETTFDISTSDLMVAKTIDLEAA